VLGLTRGKRCVCMYIAFYKSFNSVFGGAMVIYMHIYIYAYLWLEGGIRVVCAAADVHAFGVVNRCVDHF